MKNKLLLKKKLQLIEFYEQMNFSSRNITKIQIKARNKKYNG